MTSFIPVEQNRYGGLWRHTPWIFRPVEEPTNAHALHAIESFEARDPQSMILRMETSRVRGAPCGSERVQRKLQAEALATWEDEGGVTKTCGASAPVASGRGFVD